MKTKFYVSGMILSAFMFTSCGGDKTSNSEGSNTQKTFKYTYSTLTCSTDEQVFKSEKAYCEGLLDHDNNNNCAYSKRIEAYKTKCNEEVPVQALNEDDSLELLIKLIQSNETEKIKSAVNDGIKVPYYTGDQTIPEAIRTGQLETAKLLIKSAYKYDPERIDFLYAGISHVAGIDFLDEISEIYNYTPNLDNGFFLKAIIFQEDLELVKKLYSRGYKFGDIKTGYADARNVFTFQGTLNSKELFDYFHKELGLSLLIDINKESRKRIKRSNISHKIVRNVRTVEMAKHILDSIIAELEEANIDTVSYLVSVDRNEKNIINYALSAKKENSDHEVANYVLERFK